MEDLLLTGIGHLTTNDAEPIEGAAVSVRDGRVDFVGVEGDAPQADGAEVIDCGGRAVIPGFVDSHTHLVFAGDRSGEFRSRMEGADYRSIAAAGGGIAATVAATRSTDEETLVREASDRALRMVATGTTALEIKSGYGLDLETELKILRVARRVGDETGIPVRCTFLGAHAIPPEFATDRDAYIELVIDTMLPQAKGLADDCDVFVEDGAFTVDEASAILTRARELGFGVRVHAEQLTHSGGAMLAARLGAMSADHLDNATRDDAEALAEAGVAAVLVPGASYTLRRPQAPGPMLWEAGCTVAIATDCNPGTSYFESMGLVISLAVVQMGLTVEQAVWAATRGGALALAWGDRGVIRRGAEADLVVLDAPSPTHLAYRPATDLVGLTVTGGVARSRVGRHEVR